MGLRTRSPDNITSFYLFRQVVRVDPDCAIGTDYGVENAAPTLVSQFYVVRMYSPLFAHQYAVINTLRHLGVSSMYSSSHDGPKSTIRDYLFSFLNRSHFAAIDNRKGVIVVSLDGGKVVATIGP